jgi:hypothetical protein
MGFLLQTKHFLVSLDIFFLGNHVVVYLDLPHTDDSLRQLITIDSLYRP